MGLNNTWAVKRFAEPEVWAEIAATKMDVDLIQFSFDLLDPMIGEDCPKRNDTKNARFLHEVRNKTAKLFYRRYRIHQQSSVTSLLENEKTRI